MSTEKENPTEEKVNPTEEKENPKKKNPKEKGNPKEKKKPKENANLKECAVGLIIFGLDGTLWPFTVGVDVNAPFKKNEDNTVRDRTGSIIPTSDSILKIFKKLRKDKIKVAIVSRSSSPETAVLLLKALRLKNLINYSYIYHEGQKVKYLKKLRKKSGIEYTKMISFENKEKDMADVQGLGIHCVLVKEGLSMQIFTDAIENFARICAQS